ncbi:signal recognition particle-docking protein FtsY [Endozoicomonas arenosclerae]|uniref:signal recognition particle-docking protein FtsY n=1 Tax=Endozoicomonas arenosclerae TaxID=1633495 RepID=UPI00078501BB|nr:signal recognition particle-docking protein FtsY [Endozoicomonas arenosclerae]
MFGSRKSDEKTAKRRFWPWGRKEEKKSEPAQVVEESPKAELAAPQEEVVQAEVVEQIVEKTEEVTSVEPVQVEPVQEPEAEVVTSEIAEEIKPQEQVSPVSEAAPVEPSAASVEEPAEVVAQAPAVEAVEEVEAPTEAEETPAEVEATPAVQETVQPQEEKKGFFARMKRGLGKTRNAFVDGVAEIFVGKKEIDEDLLEELETQLLVSDVGVEATTEIIQKLTKKVKYRELNDADALISALKAELKEILEPADKPLVIDEQKTPYVILVVGVNGVGKTTTIGKVARKLQAEGRKVMLAAGDTFRAAAVEQLQVWGERNDIPVIAQHTGADSASVLYDAFEAAKARGVDVLIADTAGRLHNKDNLMEELRKVKRVLGKLDDSAPHEVLLVLDAGTGQNALNQAKIFHESVNLTGMALTKLDGTAKGGVVFALSKQMQLPIRFLGVGEQIDDLRPFSADEFVEALFDPVEP